MLELGDTIRVNEHVCVIASDPKQNAQEVLLVAFTTLEPYKDDTCLIEAGEHPRISHQSCIAYDFFDYPLFELSCLLKFQKCEPVSSELLKRILEGADTTKRINTRAWVVLNDQGLV